MNYISVKEAAKQWHLSPRAVQIYCLSGRIAGASKYGNYWLVPADAKKPKDLRKEKEEEVSDEALPEGSVFPLHSYLKGQKAEDALQLCLSTEEALLLKAWIAYMRGDIKLTGSLLSDSSIQVTKSISVQLGTAYISGIVAMYEGNLSAWNASLNTIKHMASISTAHKLQKELVQACLEISLHSLKDYPSWLQRGKFDMLPSSLFSSARYLYVKMLYLQYREIDMLAIAEPLIGEAHREHNDLDEIYLRILASCGYWCLGDESSAREHLSKAAVLALPSGFIAPFAEYRRNMQTLMDSYFSSCYPELLKPMTKLNQALLHGWTELYNSLMKQKMADSLTAREFEACALSAWGYTNSQIAQHMNISVNSVKKYLNVSFQKLHISHKADLSQLIHR